MTTFTLDDLQASLQDKTAFDKLEDYFILCYAFLDYIEETQPTRIVSPDKSYYLFFQYGEAYRHKITRPLNSTLFLESTDDFKMAFERLAAFLGDLRRSQASAVDREAVQSYLGANGVNKVIYTIQQSAGSISDSFASPNQARKRVGQLFENLVKLIIQEVGLECESRTVRIPIPGHPGYTMSYELDLVFSRDKAVIAAENKFIYPSEVVGSVKTTSKDRIDKIFLDKYMLTRLLGRDIPVIAIFLHDVQRARRGSSIFGINSTFKSNHFLGYTIALNRLDGVYYVDPRPIMVEDERLNEEIQDFQQFLTKDLWTLSNRQVQQEF